MPKGSWDTMTLTKSSRKEKKPQLSKEVSQSLKVQPGLGGRGA